MGAIFAKKNGPPSASEPVMNRVTTALAAVKLAWQALKLKLQGKTPPKD